MSESPPPLVRIIEAVCFVEGGPVTARRLCEIIPDLTPEQFHRAIHELQRSYREQGRPYGFVRHGEGYLLTVRPQYRFLVERLYSKKREAVLSLAAIEVLAIIAYRQPVSRSSIEALRGRDSSAAIRQLLRRGLIAVFPARDKPAQCVGSNQPVSGSIPTARNTAPLVCPAEDCSAAQESIGTILSSEAGSDLPQNPGSGSPDQSRLSPTSKSQRNAFCTGECTPGQTPQSEPSHNRSTPPADETPSPQVNDELADELPTSSHPASRRNRREVLYVTTPRFLQLFNLRDLSDLPRTDDLEIL